MFRGLCCVFQLRDVGAPCEIRTHVFCFFPRASVGLASVSFHERLFARNTQSDRSLIGATHLHSDDTVDACLFLKRCKIFYLSVCMSVHIYIYVNLESACICIHSCPCEDVHELRSIRRPIKFRNCYGQFIAMYTVFIASRNCFGVSSRIHVGEDGNDSRSLWVIDPMVQFNHIALIHELMHRCIVS